MSSSTENCQQNKIYDKPTAPAVNVQERQIYEDPIPTPSNQIVQIPNEYDFDIMQLLADVDNEEMSIPDEPTSQLMPSNQHNNMTSTTKTQINVNRPEPEIPNFAHCHSGTINFKHHTQMSKFSQITTKKFRIVYLLREL